MNVTKFVFKSHKWLAVTTGLITFVWFLSAIFMVMPGRFWSSAGLDESLTSVPARYRDLAISVPQAIAAVEQGKGRSIDVLDVSFRQIGGQLFYRISTRDGAHLVNGSDGTLLVMTEAVARNILVARGANAASLNSHTRVEAYDLEYRWGPLPAWRFATNDARGTIYYVDTNGGDARSTIRLGRARDFLTGLHSLDFLIPWMSRTKIRFIMWVFSLVGTVMTLFGFWILCLQYQNWRARRAS